MKEKQVKLVVGEWLEKLGCEIFDEGKNPVKENWGRFEVYEGDVKPDLVVKAKVRKEKEKRRKKFISPWS